MTNKLPENLNFLQKAVLKVEEIYKVLFGTQQHYNKELKQTSGVSANKPASPKGQNPADMLERATIKRAENNTHSGLSLPEVPQNAPASEKLSPAQIARIDHIHGNGAEILGTQPIERMVIKNPKNKSKAKVSA